MDDLPLHFHAAITTTAIAVLVSYVLLKKKSKKRRRIWTKPWLQRRTRHNNNNVLSMLNEELLQEDPASYKNFLRMSNQQFETLLSYISDSIKKNDTFMRESICPRDRLEVTLRFLATGETFRSLMYSTRIHETTISKIVLEVCQAIIKIMQPIYLQTPTTKDEWRRKADEFDEMWQFPHCLGSLDGKHITFKPPISAGSYYYNYKGTNSIVLLGLSGASYKFLYVNIGCNGRISDGGVFQNSDLYRKLSNGTLNIPDPQALSNDTENIPYVILADDAFPLSENIMKPYPERGLDFEKRIFNYRLSRGRRIIENAFGILANRFRVLLNPMQLHVKKVEMITFTCVVLHNFLASQGTGYTTLEDDFQHLPSIAQQAGNRSSQTARETRDLFKNFFNSPEGAVSWKNKAVNNFNL